ncbi:MAG: bifunctional diaminohydroxyphosphoribosylaminopyrimidine deaminase/5-amino-6-(5-phosphoribosylamino)uracil reductase RibD [Clostridia bacterium]|nr:bifunctional diaminohydroxyphosphoribosylaminopyrimidine deaminase/5-amino-6-(5-phosphoribosylamino)uracil reductase RibD [Clostridia bacterium]
MEEKYMRRAIELAKGGTGFTNPNPLVGAVIVKDGQIIGEGFHEKYGSLHAERNAIKNATADVKGADIYVTLEPCCHTGKQPPCTEAIIESGIKRVIIGSRDPNPLVHGKGAKILRDKGIEVVEDFLRDECDALNDIFFHYISTKTPYVIMKTAISADGKIATKSGHSKWVTSEESRMHSHEIRKRVAAILVGSNTVKADNPSLTCRTENPSNPIRIICDSHLTVPITSNVVQTASEVPTYIAFTAASEERQREFTNLGVKLIKTPRESGHVDLKFLMQKLGEMGIDSVLIEGGGEIHASALKSGIVQRLMIYTAPKLIGGDGKNAVGAIGVSVMDEAVMLKNTKITRLGDDILTEYEVK